MTPLSNVPLFPTKHAWPTDALTPRRLIVGHGLGAAAHSWLGLGRGAHCSPCSGSRLQADGALQRHAVDEVVDWNDAGGGGELRDAAAGRPRPGSFGETAARLAGEESVVLELRGCPRLTVPLAGDLADRTEDAIRQGFELSRSLRESVQLPWADRPASELQVAAHYRAGDLVTTLPKHDGAGLPPLLQQAFSLAPPPRGAAQTTFAFDTRRGGRLLLLSYVLAALRAIRAALPRGVALRLHLFAEGLPAWFEPLAEQLPQLQLHLAPPGGPPERSLEHLHALTSADVLLLGGGAFSELSASLGRAAAVKLAPADVWQGLPFRVPGAEAVHYPSGALSAGAAKALRRLHAERQQASYLVAAPKVFTLPPGPPLLTADRGAEWATEL